MAHLLVAGLINIETTIKIERFPVAYTPVRYPFHGVQMTVSGVGFNITKALTMLGNTVDFYSLIADDSAGHFVRAALKANHIDDSRVLSWLDATPQSAILYDDSGRRMINSDLKSIQDSVYPADRVQWQGIDLAVLANINCARPLLQEAKKHGVTIATDVHAIGDIHDDYNRDFMAAADVLFMSHENLPVAPKEWIQQVQATYEIPVIVIGMGADGALLAVKADRHVEHIPARALRPVVNTVGSGDALFSAFVHEYAQSGDPYPAIRKAVLFAGYKIGSAGGADGFLTASELDAFYRHYH